MIPRQGMRFDETIIIGEKLNSTNSNVMKALEGRDIETLLSVARAQVEGGASYIDINAAMLMEGELEALLWAGSAILEKIGEGISVDSSDPGVLIRCADEFGPRCIVNSLTADRVLLEEKLPLLAKSGAGAIVMLKTSEGIPERASGRVALASEASELAAGFGLTPERIYFDPVFQPLATGSEGLGTALETLSALADAMPDYHRIGGLSNVSYGMPKRKVVNRAFLAIALSHGLSAVICDPTDRALVDTLKAAEALTGSDPGCIRFIKHHRDGKRG